MRRILPLLLPVLIASLAMAAPASAGGPIATVDIVRLIQAHPKFPELRKQYEDRQQKAKDYAKAEDTRLQKLKGELDLMTPNEPAFLQKQKEVAAGLQMLKFEMEWRETTAQREYVRGLEILYSEATLSVQSYVRTQQGLQLVLVEAAEGAAVGRLQRLGPQGPDAHRALLRPVPRHHRRDHRDLAEGAAGARPRPRPRRLGPPWRLGAARRLAAAARGRRFHPAAVGPAA